MSHFVRIQTHIREQALLERALSSLGHSFRTSRDDDLAVRGYQGNKSEARLVVDTGTAYDIGFERSGESFDIVADWWGVEGNSSIRKQEFTQSVQRAYAFELVRQHARQNNLVWESEQVQENGNTVIVLSERG